MTSHFSYVTTRTIEHKTTRNPEISRRSKSSLASAIDSMFRWIVTTCYKCLTVESVRVVEEFIPLMSRMRFVIEQMLLLLLFLLNCFNHSNLTESDVILNTMINF